MTLTTGQILYNRYRIARLLGQGGFGAVYKAWDTTLNRPCALKESFELGAEAGRQFLREAQILANLSHPNLPRVTDFFTVPGVGQYLVMDFVKGQDLDELLAQAGGKLPEAQALAYITQACEALEYLHSQTPPVIHRDIKPANLKIAPADKYYPQGRVMLVDFGVAKVYEAGTKTTIGARAVTPGYSPYEQYGQGTTDTRSDIYALGATLYTLLTGQVPVESVQRMVRDPLIPPRQLEPGISPGVEAGVLKALQMDPELRYQSAAEFKEALQTDVDRPPLVTQLLLSTPVAQASTTGTSALPPAPKSTPAERKRKLPVWVTIMIVLAGIGGLAILLVIVAGSLLIPSSSSYYEPASTAVPATSTLIRIPTATRIPTRTPVPARQDVPTTAPTTVQGSDRILYIYFSDPALAAEYQAMLTNEGFDVDAIHMDRLPETDFSQFGLIIVGPDTIGSGEAAEWYNAWGDEQTAARLNDSGKPIIGLGLGGYGLFGRLNLRIGGGWGAQGGDEGLAYLRPYRNILQEPNIIPEGEVDLYNGSVETREIFLGSDVEPLSQSFNIIAIDLEIYVVEGVTNSYSRIVLQDDRYFFWGYDVSPNLLTEDGKALFENVVHFFLTTFE